MPRPVPFKLIFIIALFAAVLTAAAGVLYQSTQKQGAKPGDTLSMQDREWLKQRLARTPMPAPRPGQPQVILVWRARSDVAKVRDYVSQVCHPEGKDGVYGVDLCDSDALASKLKFSQLMGSVQAPGAWLLVFDRTSRLIGSTPIISNEMVELAFKMARGEKVTFPGSEDPYLDKTAPDFKARTLDGRTISMSGLTGKPAILTFYCGCERCEKMSLAMAQMQKSPYLNGVQFLTATSMLADKAKGFFTKTGERSTAFDDSKHSVASQYDSNVCPRVWYVARNGLVKYYSKKNETSQIVIPALTNAMKGSGG